MLCRVRGGWLGIPVWHFHKRMKKAERILHMLIMFGMNNKLAHVSHMP